MTIYDRYPSPKNSWTQVGCAQSWNENTIFRVVDVSTTSTGSSPTTTSFASTSEPSLTSLVPTSTTSTAAEDSQPSKSKAWIAGPVAGGVAGLLFLGALFFWWRGRKNKKASVVEEPTMAQTGPGPGPTGGGYQGQQPEYIPGNPHDSNYASELYSPSSPHLPAGYYPSQHSIIPGSSPTSPGVYDASSVHPAQYNYLASMTPMMPNTNTNMTTWQAMAMAMPVAAHGQPPPPPPSEMQHTDKQVLVEAPCD